MTKTELGNYRKGFAIKNINASLYLSAVAFRYRAVKPRKLIETDSAKLYSQTVLLILPPKNQ